MSALRHLTALLLAAATCAAADRKPGCVTVEGDRITAGDLARAIPALSAVPPETVLGYAPVPGARRSYQPAELRRLALRYSVTLPESVPVCIERTMETLGPERVLEAMRKALNDPEARITILELSRAPVPRGEVEFDRAVLPFDASGPVIWRGVVRYAGGQRYGIWARVNLRVRVACFVAAEKLIPGQPIDPGQVKPETCDTYPVTHGTALSTSEITGRLPRLPIAPGTSITAAMLDAPKDVQRGDVVQVEVQSGAALLKLEGRAETAGRRGDAIRVHSLATGRSFSARIADRNRVVVTTAVSSKTQDGSQ